MIKNSKNSSNLVYLPFPYSGNISKKEPIFFNASLKIKAMDLKKNLPKIARRPDLGNFQTSQTNPQTGEKICGNKKKLR